MSYNEGFEDFHYSDDDDYDNSFEDYTGDVFFEECSLKCCNDDGQQAYGVVKKERTQSKGPNLKEPKESEQKFIEAVIPLLKEGITSFNDLSVMLFQIDTDFLRSGDNKYEQVRRVILKAKESLEKSEKAANNQLRSVDTYYESLTVKKGSLGREKEERKKELGSLKSEYEAKMNSLQMYTDSLETEMANLQSTNETVENLQRKINESNNLTAVGAGLMAIPVFGWIAGGIMIGVSQTDIQNAEAAKSQAIDAVRKTKESIETYSTMVQECKNAISEKEAESDALYDFLAQIDQDIMELSRQHHAIAEVQSKLRHAITILGKLVGGASVVELQTRCFFFLDPIMTTLQEILKLAGDVVGDNLLYQKDIKELIESLRENHVKLKAINTPKGSSANAIHDYL